MTRSATSMWGTNRSAARREARHPGKAMDKAWLAGRRGARIDDAVVKSILTMVDQSGIVDEIAAWRAQDRVGKHPGGRPATVSDRAVLVLLMVLANECSPIQCTRMTDLVMNRMSGRALAAIGITSRPVGDDAVYNRVWRAARSMFGVVDPFPGPRGHLLTKDEHERVRDGRDPEVSEAKRDRLDRVSNWIVEVSVRQLDPGVLSHYLGNLCIDATFVATHGVGRSPSAPFVSIEPDAAFYVREGDHRDPGDAKGTRLKKAGYGYEAHLAVMGDNNPGTTTAELFPKLVLGMRLDKPGFDIAGNAMSVLRSIHGRGYPAKCLAADRAYLPGCKAEEVQLPLRALGYEPVFDYKEDQLGIKDSYEGAILVEGGWYCPQMPGPLVDATLDYRKGVIDEAQWRQRIAQRRSYAFRRKAKPDPDGYVPMMCPACGPNATAICPLKTTVGSPAGRTKVTIGPGPHPKVCTNVASVTFPPAAGAKYRQPLRFGTNEWQNTYSTLRNTIEGFNGYLKDAAYSGLGQRTRFRIRGFAAHSINVALAVFASNLRKIATFGPAEPVRGDQERGPATRVRRPRRRDTLKKYTVTPDQLHSGDPPAA
jgi:hypothetical protein